MNTEVRFLLAIGLMIAVIVVTNLLFPPITPVGVEEGVAPAVDTPAARAPEPGPAAPPDLSDLPGTTGVEPEPDTATPPAPPVGEPERFVEVEGPLFAYRFSSRGARLLSAELLSFRSFTREGPVQLVPEGTSVLGSRLVVGQDTLDLRELPFEVVDGRERIEISPGGPNETLTFRYAAPSGGFAFEITYAFHADGYLIDARGQVRGVDRPLLVTDMGTGLAFNEANLDEEAQSMAYVVNHLDGGINSNQLSDVESRQVVDGPLLWSALKSKYFVLALMPATNGTGQDYLGGLLVDPVPEPHRAHLAGTHTVGSGGEFDFRVFMGPQEYARLTALGSDLEEVNPYGWRFFRPVIRPFVSIIMTVLVFLHETFDLAYGWVLVVFGVFMRILLWPLNQKAMRAQMRNMAVQPLLKEIQTKYKDNPEKLQKEMMRLYKEYGFNPVAGCLPMLLPWPVLISLFFVFQNTIELRGAEFFWIPDLSSPDPIYLLPAVLGISMFLLQFISLRSMEESNPQMKMMMWIMPVFMVFIFFNLAAGLNLYYAVSNLATIPQQVIIAGERKKAQAKGPVKRTGG
ncbi:MAG: membrane protein insertase YidC [Gemmatimonadetes bacterium]|nr:membrane protein insertase YidC [Gemmatimonadota bacterium]